MENKRQITVLVSVPVTLEYNSKQVSEEDIKVEISNQIKATLLDHIEWFVSDDSDQVTVREFSVCVNDIMPTNYLYD